MCKAERKEIKKHDAWNRKHYGKKLAKMYRKLTNLECEVSKEMLSIRDGGPLPSSATLDKVKAYTHKCWQALSNKYFWSGDAYYMAR